ncbi:MAG: GAF domain-containing protein [Chloroflexi bacterium]|nr:GAF domain-containing protein [Chloroflexota bacterium]
MSDTSPHSPLPAESDALYEPFSQLFDGHQAVMLLIEPETGAILRANQAACAFYGYENAALCALNVTDIVQLHPEKAAHYRQSAIRRERNQFVVPHRLASGEVRTVEVRASPMDINGHSVLLSIVHDITEHANTERDLRQLAQRLTMLNDIGQAIASTLDLDQILSILLERTRQAVGAEACSVALLDESHTELVFHRAAGVASQDVIGLRLKRGQGVAGWVVEHQQSALILDTATDQRFLGQIDTPSGFQTRNLICVPMFAHNVIIGVLEQINKVSGAFDAADVQLLEAVAAQTAVAIDNARLFDAERRSHQRLETLYRIGQTVNSTLDPAAILEQLIDEAMRATHATHGAALIARPAAGNFERRAQRGYSPELIARAAQHQLPLTGGINGRAYATRQVIAVNDVRLDPDYFPLVPETRSELVIPILRGDSVLGHIDLQSPHVNGFSEVDLDFLRVLADQVAVALENARLYQEAQRHATELEARVRERTAALRDSEETARVLLNAAPDAAYLLDANGTLLAANAPGAEDLATSVEQLVGVNLVDLFEPALAQARRAQVNRAINTGQPIRFQDERAGRYFENVIYPIRGAAGVIDRVAVYSNDVTERRQAEIEMQRALDKEKELSELKSRFISVASHEFRTPLTTILSSAELLEHYSHRWSDAKKLEYLKRIQTAVQHMVDLINDVLVVGRSDAGKQAFEPAPLDLIGFCGSIISEIQPDGSHPQPIVFLARGDCANAVMDERLLRHILSNLLSNAIKYSPPGAPVQFNLHEQAGQVVFEISDHGIGIPLDDLAHLYDTFHRASNVGNIAGTGLGMTIVKRSVDLHGGKIEVDSHVGTESGTRFTVTLPLVSVPPEPAVSAPENNAAPTPPA